ncbi:hypothetical protein E2320_001721, partial [Naja naja]
MTSCPVAKPSTTVHFAEFTPDELLDYGKDINHLTNCQQLPQQRGWNPGSKPQQFSAACGGNHLRPACKFRNAICLNCQRRGHIARAFKSGEKKFQSQPQPQARHQKQRDECFT